MKTRQELKANIEKVLNKKNNHVNSFEVYLNDELIDYFEDITHQHIKDSLNSIGYNNFNNVNIYLCRGSETYYCVSVTKEDIQYTENN